MEMKWKLLSRKTSIEPDSRKCSCRSIKDCPYNVKSECKFNKSTCLLNEVPKRNRHNITNLRIALWGCLGLLCFIITTICSNTDSLSFPYSTYIYDIVQGVSTSVLAGAVLTFVIDLPSKLQDYERSFVNALSSNTYLKSLDEVQLTKLRNNVTDQLHKANAPFMAESLIDVDQHVCELLRKPYNARYRQSVICEPINDDIFIKKKHIIDYKLINPYGANKEAKAYIRLNNMVVLNEDTNVNDVISELEISCLKDDNEKIEYTSEQYDLIKESVKRNNEFYNAWVRLYEKNTKTKPIEPGIRIDFKDNIRVHIQYKIKVHKDDICFTKRLQYPVKNFRLDYSCAQKDAKLYGQIFGTNIKQNDISIRQPSSNAISLESFEWILPGDGAIVVMLNG